MKTGKEVVRSALGEIVLINDAPPDCETLCVPIPPDPTRYFIQNAGPDATDGIMVAKFRRVDMCANYWRRID